MFDSGSSMFSLIRSLAQTPGIAVILFLSLTSTVALLFLGSDEKEEMEFWLFSKSHRRTYGPVVQAWNAAQPGRRFDVDISLLSLQPLERRLLSGFVSDTPVPDLTEIESTMAGRFFAGPLDAVGFLDLTDRIEQEGLLESMNAPSFSPWTDRGRIFGLPHDIHPVLLAYRADLVEAAGIEVDQIETWDDFERVMRPLQRDEDGDGHPDRYLLNIWDAGSPGELEVLIRQAGGEYFTRDGQVQIASPVNAMVLARVVTWVAGPNRIATLAASFSAEGNEMYLKGEVLTQFMPDWMTGVWKRDMPGLAGKFKLMPLPAWEPGGLRTSVRGGTMAGIPKHADEPEKAWQFIKKLYTSQEVAEALYRTSGIISPTKTHWDLPMYQEPDPFFGGQRVGQLYLEQAPHVPLRVSTPYHSLAGTEVANALIRTRRWAEEQNIWDREALQKVAMTQLQQAEAKVRSRMEQNVFRNAEDAR